jgi:signal transduction histidine kinase
MTASPPAAPGRTTERLQRRVLTFATLGVLVVSALVGAAVLVPLSAALRGRVESDLAHLAQTRAAGVGEFLAHARDVAVQVTSRTKAREMLVAWQAGQVDTDAFVAFEEPILRDALNRSEGIVGIVRLDASGAPAVRVGAPLPPDWAKPSGARRGAAELRGPERLGEGWMLAVAAPILDRQGETVGSDVVLFQADRLESLLREDGPEAIAAGVLVFRAADGSLQWMDPADPAASSRGTPGPPLMEAARLALGGESGVLTERDLDAVAPSGGDARRVLAFAPVPGTHHAVVLRADADRLYAADGRRFTAAALLVACLALLGAAAVPFVLRPLAGRVVLREEELQGEVDRQTAELRRANEELRQFASVLAHDFRSPMQSVLMGAELLAEELEGEGEERAAIVAGIQQGILRMGSMLDDLLRYARAGREELHPESVDLNELASEVLQDLRSVIVREQAKVVLDDLPPVRGEATRLRQLLLNLVANAIKYRRPEVAPVVRITGARRGDRVEIRVEDNGRGIAEADLERIFELFQRAANAGAVEGTGLGLALCKKIAEQHGGHLFVESQPGRGSAFWCSLPADESAQARNGVV